MTLEKILRVLAGRWLLITLSIVAATVAAYITVKMQPKIYSATAKLIIDFKEPTSLNAILPSNLQGDYLATQIGILTSQHVAGKAVDLLGFAEDPEVIKRFEEETGGQGQIRDWLVDIYRGGLRVYTDDNSRLVSVRYRSEDPEVAAKLTNAFVDAYIDTVLSLNVEPARKSAEWIDQQLAELRQALEAAQSRLSAYQQEKGIVATDNRVDIEMARLSSLADQLATAQAEVETFQSRLSQVRETDELALLQTLPEVLSNSYVQSLKGDLRRKETELAQISSQVGSGHPQYQRIAAELRSLRAKLKDEMGKVVQGMRVQLEAARNRVNSLEAAQAEQKAKLLNLRKTADDLPVYVREVENAQKNYDEALARFQQYTLQSRVKQTNVSVLSRAGIPKEPAGVKSRIKMLLAAFLGLVVGVCLAILLELKNRLIRGKDDTVEAVGAPLLGILHKG